MDYDPEPGTMWEMARPLIGKSYASLVLENNRNGVEMPEKDKIAKLENLESVK